MEATFVVKSIKELDEIAKQLLAIFGSQKKIVFFGEMGVGKTTLIKAICKRLNVKDEVVSPTFSVVNEYHNKSGEVFYHFDFYRIKSKEEIYDLGYEDYFFTDAYCFIEWPEKAFGLLKDNNLQVHIKTENQKRMIKVISHD
ncbi:MAG: tRNA (adenosine(37)-N6)-threonylcarbamoyltransferase complex ATPase subunit type 1 TsaE [Bacteroidota bacterium]|nr:tRNA (adenosine(37)-N6)-threonylcarbamoyltransferase complex ATPase subunit type 1 TsaE [Bacteroidota bacterium]